MTPATILQHDGIKQPIIEWALDYGITPKILIGRLERGMTIANAITMPMKTGHRGQRLPVYSRKQLAAPRSRPSAHAKTYTYEGKTLTVREWSRLTGIKQTTIASRIRKGWSIDRALTAARDGRGRKPGVVSNFAPSKGTGARSVPQAMAPENNFSGNEACPQ
ncbi:hypothetical protein [Ensifer canadensis]